MAVPKQDERARVRAARLLAVAGGLALLSGCQSEAADSSLLPLVSSPQAVTVWDPACAGLYAGIAHSSQLSGQGLRSVTLCLADYLKDVQPGETIALDDVAPATQTVIITAEQAPDALAALAELLSTADSSRPSDLVCTAELRTGVDFTVITDSGEELAPRIPLDECGKISLRVQKLLAGLAQGRF